MADYSSQIATAARLIKQKGMVVTHRRKLFSGTYDPVTDSYTEASVDTDVWAVRTEAGEPEQKNYGFAIGSFGGVKPIPTPDGVPVAITVPDFSVSPADSSSII